MATTRRALLSKLLMTAAPVVVDPGKHTLVCVFLRGGADTMNMIVPYADDAYYRARPSLAIKAPANGSSDSSRALRLDDHYALNPVMKSLLPMFQNGRMGIVQSVGLDSDSGSHFECQDQMEHGDSVVAPAAGGGWLGRFLRARADSDRGPLSAVAVGTTLPESLRGAPVVSVMKSLDEISLKTPAGKPEAAAAALAKLYGADVTLLGHQGRDTLALFERVRSLQTDSSAPSDGAVYPKEEFGNGMREIARLVKAQVGLEVACIDLDNWDTHFVQGALDGFHATKARLLADTLAAFETDLGHLRKNVTVLVMTEFGRRIYENSSLGTDHGRGFATMIFSDRLRGGKVFGPWPSVVEEGMMVQGTPAGPGGLMITHDYRSVFSEVLRGSMSVKSTDSIFPGLKPTEVGLLA